MDVTTFYTTEQVKWIENNAVNFERILPFTEAFNKHFNCNRTESAIRTKINKLGLKLTRKDLYTKEQDEWIYNNIDEFSYSVLAKEFNKRFNKTVTSNGIKVHCRQKKIKKKNPHPCKENPIGHEFKNCYGYIYVKVRNMEDVNEDVLDGARQHRVRRYCYEMKQRVIWEQHNGKIPEGYQIVFLNNDKEDFRLENLCCIPKKYLAHMRHNNWFSTNPEITLTAIKWCEMMYATKE